MSHARRVFVDFPDSDAQSHGSTVSLSRDDSHHFLKVLRLKEGDPLTVVSRKDGNEFDAIVASTVNNVLVARLLGSRARARQHSRVSTLICALAKGKNTDFVCEKSCELGVQTIVLWQSERSVVRISSQDDQERKLQRWKKITESAAKQSGNDFIPDVRLARRLSEVMDFLRGLAQPGDIKLLCSLSPDAKLPRDMRPPEGNVHLIVGPEGDFTPEEEEALVKSGFARLSLGPLVLRCETAAVVAVSMVHGAWGFRG